MSNNESGHRVQLSKRLRAGRMPDELDAKYAAEDQIQKTWSCG
jgi:hypothetical protein